MKILITGAAGQIGSGLAKLLIEKNYQLLLVDNLRNGHKANLLSNNELIAPFVNVDITTQEFFSACKGTYDCIIHLAAITSLPDCETNPYETISINVGGTSNVLEFARKNNVPHVIFASTSAVYENSNAEIFTEDLEINPTLYYCLSKKMAEELVNSYRENYNMKVTTLRFFNVFGPDGDHTRLHPPLINFLVREFKKGISPQLSGDGTQTRDFIWVNDVVSMLDICLDKQPNDTFNVCTGQVISVNQMGQWVAESLECEHIGLSYKPPQELWSRYPQLFDGGYPLNKEVVSTETTRPSKGSYQKAKDLLGWEPNLDIESLVKKVAKEIVI
jgi:UDP-glucose 4-epimerase